jgi:hypothetical protein
MNIYELILKDSGLIRRDIQNREITKEIEVIASKREDTINHESRRP